MIALVAPGILGGDATVYGDIDVKALGTKFDIRAVGPPLLGG
jgi:hypothetical protein